MIRFACPFCGLAVSAPEDCAGRSTKCRSCNNSIVVPQVATTPASVRPPKPPVLHDKNARGRVVSPTSTNAKPPVASASSPARHNSPLTKAEKLPKSITSAYQQPAQPRKRSILAKLVTVGAVSLLLFGAGGMFGIGVYRYLDSQKNTGNPSGDNSYAELPVNPLQPPREPVPPGEPRASKQAQVPASEKSAETNGEQQPGARRQQHPSEPTADEVDGDSLLRALKKALMEYIAPTDNVFKRQKAREKYLATLNSYRDRQVRLRVKVSRVGSSMVEVDVLPLDDTPQHFRAVLVDFSGINFGTDIYRKVNVLDPQSNTWVPTPRDRASLRNLIPNDKFDAKVLHNLEKGQYLYIKGRIVSLTQLEPQFVGESHIILSLKTEQIAVTSDKTNPPAARATQTRKRDSNHTLLWLHDALEAKRLGAVSTEDFLVSAAEVPIIRNCCRRIWKIQTVDDQTIQQVADWLAERKGMPLKKIWDLPLEEVATALQEEARKH